MDKDDVTIEVLKQIRDEVKLTRTDRCARPPPALEPRRPSPETV